MRSVALALAFALVSLARPVMAQRPDLAPPAETRHRETDAPASEPAPAPEPEAEAPNAPRYGARGSFQITNAFSVGGSSTSYAHSDALFGSVAIEPALDWFLAKDLALGLAAHASWSSSRGYFADGGLVETRRTRFGGALRLLYVLELSERASLVPRVSFGVDSTESEREPVQSSAPFAAPVAGLTRTTAVGPFLSAYVPLVFHPTRHFFVGIGPSVLHRFARVLDDPSAGGMQTAIGAGGVVGIWWGGERAEPQTDPEPPQRERFGEAGQVVLTGAFDASFVATTNTGTGSEAQSFTLSPGADWFIRDHLSLGIDLAMSVTHTKSLIPATTQGGSGSVVTANDSAFAIGPRIGAEFRLGDVISLYPRAAFDLGFEDVDIKSGTGENKHSVTTTALVLSAPLLFHVTSHAFFGAGPSLYTELTASEKDNDATPRATRIGGETLIGGWF